MQRIRADRGPLRRRKRRDAVPAAGCTYQLTAALPDITTNLTLVGAGATLDGGGSDFTILTVDSSGNLTAINVNFRDGGVYVDDDSDLTGNDATGGGGGIYNDSGTVTLNDSSVSVNTPGNCEPTGTIAGCTG